MNFYKEIEPYVEYLFSIRKLENYFSIDMKFPMKWGIPKSMLNESEVVPFDCKEENLKGMSFVCTIGEEETNLVFSKISRIIKVNKERELKDRLFKDTVEMLKQTFEKTDLDKLQRLYFDFDSEIEKLEDDDDQEQQQSKQQSTIIELAE